MRRDGEPAGLSKRGKVVEGGSVDVCVYPIDPGERSNVMTGRVWLIELSECVEGSFEGGCDSCVFVDLLRCRGADVVDVRVVEVTHDERVAHMLWWDVFPYVAECRHHSFLCPLWW